MHRTTVLCPAVAATLAATKGSVARSTTEQLIYRGRAKGGLVVPGLEHR